MYDVSKRQEVHRFFVSFQYHSHVTRCSTVQSLVHVLTYVRAQHSTRSHRTFFFTLLRTNLNTAAS